MTCNRTLLWTAGILTQWVVSASLLPASTGWPALHGPTGNFLPPADSPTLTTLADAKLLWVSEDSDFGTAKTGSQSFKSAADIERRIGPNASTAPGSWAGVIVSEGMVFGSSFKPTGDFHTCEIPYKGSPPETARFRVEADDLLLALDAETGKTIWKATIPGGRILGGGKRKGFQVSPACDEHNVYWMGSTGRLFANHKKSGQQLWQTSIGRSAEMASEKLAQDLQKAKSGLFPEPPGPAWATSLVIADGVLVAPDFIPSKTGGDIGLIGFDSSTGRLLWSIPAACSRQATPAVWRNPDGAARVLSATTSGQLRLIDPRTGKILWTLDGLGPNFFSLAPSESSVILNVAARPDPSAKRFPGRWGCVRLSDCAGSVSWILPDEARYQLSTWFDNCARSRALISQGRVFLSTTGTPDFPGTFLMLDEKSGQILASHENRGPDTACIGGLFYVVNGRILSRFDACHGASHGGRHPWTLWEKRGDGFARCDGFPESTGLDLIDFVTAYETFMEVPLVDGRLYDRTVDGRIACCKIVPSSTTSSPPTRLPSIVHAR